MANDPRSSTGSLGQTHSHKPSERGANFVTSPVTLFSLAMLISACCKLTAVGSRELWLDETYSAFVANMRFGQLLHHVSGDVHPPLFYILLWVWVRIAGDAQTHLRFFSLGLNICSMFGMFALGRRLLGARFGAYAAALFAFSPMLFVYSLEVRMYTLCIFILICLLYVHWIVVVERNAAKWLIVLYSLLATALFYIHYIGVFIVIGLFVHWAIASAFVRGRVFRLLAAGVLTLLFVSPWLPVLLQQRAERIQLGLALQRSHQDPSTLSYDPSGQSPADSLKPGDFAKSAAAMAGLYPVASSRILVLFAIPFLVAFAGIGFLGLVKADEVCRLFMIVALAIGVGVVVLHIGATRYMMPLVPVLVLALSRVVQYWMHSVKWRRMGIAVGALVLCLYFAGFVRQANTRHGRPWENLVGAVQQNYQPGDVVAFDALYSQVPFDYFAQHMRFQPRESGFPVSIYDWWTDQKFRGWGGPVITQTDLDVFVSGIKASRPKTVWVVLYENYYYDPHEALVTRLQKLGPVTEMSLPSDPSITDPQNKETLRLIRVAMN
jgi:uncharacterized membrane protein